MEQHSPSGVSANGLIATLNSSGFRPSEVAALHYPKGQTSSAHLDLRRHLRATVDIQLKKRSLHASSRAFVQTPFQQLHQAIGLEPLPAPARTPLLRLDLSPLQRPSSRRAGKGTLGTTPESIRQTLTATAIHRELIIDKSIAAVAA